ncbi:hypothetical protein KAFR_0A04280 [Kazachstania africana CBS 2517]|uniref:AMMECR1 domain-containing protein n=1 Tax=Kazachstania africana (strain ATCC 22294 / BCRC 22015 / CBS 2517 / CECT 1963 / NBRC 1671 / NRRL Y-8276) TaxID=1071382 RepID=H2ANB3_KAZAF|nr:hypothetical protein KAFR_0A04280 [Kazachstania africana CBS 2517]CCF55863.1 hypothetical protein KAFR_0A04280 [Kazachstania africana CBS 2517]
MDASQQLESSPYAFYAFYTLYRHFHPARPPISLRRIQSTLYPDFKLKRSEVSLFITWQKKSKHQNEYVLRGCIGTFAKLPVSLAIERYSIIAAMEDSRFSPISQKETKSLNCCCNMLANFEAIYDQDDKGDIMNWELGKHGIELKFWNGKKTKILSATFLPDVMTEQGWDKEDTFLNLIEKAGSWSNAVDILANYEEYFIRVIRYEGIKSAINYDEFEEKVELLQT